MTRRDWLRTALASSFSQPGFAQARKPNIVLIVVNLSPYHIHSGWLKLDLGALGVQADRSFQVQDLLTHAYYVWQGPRNYVQLDPRSVPAQIFAVRHNLRREEDFDYYL